MASFSAPGESSRQQVKTRSFLENSRALPNAIAMSRWIFVLAASVLWLVACDKKAEPVPAEQPAMQIPDKPNPKLRTIRLWLGSEELTAELAIHPLERQTGMMHRTNLPETEAMLFVFPFAHQTAFWMKNTSVPLSAAYISPEGVILEIHDLKPHNTNAVTAATAQVQFVLETSQGWFQRHHVSAGAVVRAESGPLSDIARRVTQ